MDLYLGALLRRRGLPPGLSVHPVYVKLEAEQEGKYRSYCKILHDTALSVARHFNLLITENETQHFAKSIQSWKPFSDTVDSLRVLGERGYKRVILSNVDRDLLQGTIAQQGLEVDGYITAEDVGSYKPSLGHWKRFFEEYEVTKNETLHVAQSIYHDIIPCAEIGLANAWINRYNEEKPPEIRPTWALADLAELLEVLD